MDALVEVLMAIFGAFGKALNSYQQDQDAENALMAAEEELSKARARAKFAKQNPPPPVP